MKEKNYLIYFMQTFGILLVVLGHSFYQTQDNNRFVDWIYSFHMPLFFFVSGYLLKYTTRLKGISLGAMKLWGEGGYLTHKARRLLIPYVVISTAVFIPKAAVSALSVRPVGFSLHDYLHMMVYPYDNVIGSFWFMPTIFIVFVIVAYGSRLLSGRWLTLLLVFTLAADAVWGLDRESPLNIKGAAYYLFYVALGYWFCRSGIETRYNPAVSTAVAVITFRLSIAFVTKIPEFIGSEVIAAVNGIAMSIALGQLYVASRLKFLNHLYGATFTIYLLSWFPQVASQQLLLAVTDVPWPVTTTLAFISGVYVPLIVYRWVQSNKSCRAARALAWVIGL